jgi:chromosome segregation ATPase
VRPTAEEFRRELRILTLKDERRARRLALARWLAPTALAIVALFATTAMVLTREAEVQRIEAHHERVRASAAQARAVTMHTNLEEEKGRRRVVENEFRNSRATCSELEQRLIRAEQEIARQQKAADDVAAELCRLQNKGVECKPPIPTPVSSVSVVPGQPTP